jgi:tubulin alpha
LSTGSVEPYNSILAAHATMSHSDCVLLFDNKTIYYICQRDLAIECPQFANLNRIISRLVSSLTSSIRFERNLNSNLNEIVANLVPYQRTHFLTESFAPLCLRKDTVLPNQTHHFAQLTHSGYQSKIQ